MNELMYRGIGAHYRVLLGWLEEGEVLVVRYVYDNIPTVAVVKDEDDYNQLVRQATYGFYKDIAFYASPTGSLHIGEYSP